MKKLFFVILLAFMLTACATKVNTTPTITQQNLLQKCTTDTPIPKRSGTDSNGKPASTGTDFLTNAVEWQDVYNNCAIMHDKLVDAILEQQAVKKVQK